MAITLDGHINKHLLLKASPRDTTTGTATPFYVSATFGMSTLTSFTPWQNKWIPGLLSPSLNFGRTLFSGADPRNLASEASGVINLNDITTELDYLFNYSWDTADIEIFRGLRTQDPSLWTSVGKFTADSIISDYNQKKIRLRDTAWRLQNLLHNNFYDGTGGLGGDANLKGQWKPFMYGVCFNVPPVLIDSANLIYQFNCVASNAVTALRHGGVAFTFDADYASYAALAAATIATGKYGTCLAQGLVRPSGTIDKSIRVDATGDNRTISGHALPRTREQIARRILTSDGDISLADADLDSTSFSALAAGHGTAYLGYYWTSEITKANALTEVMSGILGYWYIKATGLVAVGYALNPGTSTAPDVLAFKDYGMSSMEIVDFISPRAITQIGYQRNFGPETRDQLAGAVSASDAQLYGLESQYSIVDTKSTIQAVYPTAETVKIQGGFANVADAAAEATRQHTLHSVPRRRYRMTLEIDQFADILDVIFTFTGVNRLTFGSSKNLICVGTDGVGFGPLTTEWWG